MGRAAAFAALLLLARAAHAQEREPDPGMNAMPGALRVSSAEPGFAGRTTITGATEWFDSPGFIFPGKNHRRSAYSLAASYDVTQSLSVGATVLASTNHDSATDPVFIYAMGDVELGARVAGELVRRDAFSVSAGVRGGLRLMQGAAPGTGIADGASPSARGLLTVAASRVRFSLDAGYLHDRSRFLLEEGRAIDAGQAYAWGISEYDAIVGGAALEIALGRVTPLVEISGRHDLDAPGDPAIVATGGLRVTASEKVALFAAADFGVSGTEIHPGRLRAPDWNLAGGLSYSFGARAARPGPTPRLPAVASNAGRLRGRALDVESASPIAGVSIELEGRVLVTDSEGRFDFGEVKTGTARLKARHPKYAPVDAPAYVTEKQVTTVRLELRPAPSSPTAGTIVGTVLDARGAPVAGARVAVAASGEERAIFTGPDGRYRIESRAGGFALTATADGHDPRTEMGTVAAGGSVEVIVRLLPKSAAAPAALSGTGKLSGRVTGTKGAIASANVTAIAADGTTRKATTNAKGRFTMELPAGEWQVAVAAIGYPTQTQRCRIDGTKPLSLEFVLVKPMKPRGAKKKTPK